MRSRPARHLLLLVVAVLALLTGCSTVPSNTPEDYAATLPDGEEPTTEADFLEACAAAGADPDYCQCFYQRIVDEVPFEDFEANDDALAEDPEDVPPQYEEFADECRDGGGGSEGGSGGGDVSGEDGATTTTAIEGSTTAPAGTEG